MTLSQSHHIRNQGASKARAVRWLLVLLLCLGCQAAWAGEALFAPLRAYLVGTGVDPRETSRWLSSPRLRFEARRLAALLSKPERSLDYGQFLAQKSIARARRFKSRYQGRLSQTQRVTGVAPEVVVAILAVESNLGSYTGDHLVFNMLASQAVLDTAAARAKLRRAWPVSQRKVFKKESFKARLAKRAAWARQELLALIRLADKARVSPFSYRGSLAGAMGMCQFVPSSLERFGADANQDGRVDLHRPHDAILSVATYLKAHGWRRGISQREMATVLYSYNRSRIYGRTVLSLAARLK